MTFRMGNGVTTIDERLPSTIPELNHEFTLILRWEDLEADMNSGKQMALRDDYPLRSPIVYFLINLAAISCCLLKLKNFIFNNNHLHFCSRTSWIVHSEDVLNFFKRKVHLAQGFGGTFFSLTPGGSYQHQFNNTILSHKKYRQLKVCIEIFRVNGFEMPQQ